MRPRTRSNIIEQAAFNTWLTPHTLATNQDTLDWWDAKNDEALWTVDPATQAALLATANAALDALRLLTIANLEAVEDFENIATNDVVCDFESAKSATQALLDAVNAY